MLCYVCVPLAIYYEEQETQDVKILAILTSVPWSHSTVEIFEELIINIRPRFDIDSHT